MLFVALSVTSILSSTEATIISTALPTIVHNLNVGRNYAWIANAYFLTWQANSPLSMTITDRLCEV
jgi:MFS family permease